MGYDNDTPMNKKSYRKTGQMIYDFLQRSPERLANIEKAKKFLNVVDNDAKHDKMEE